MTDVIYLDFQKAFDTVPHKVLWTIGIQGNLWNWFYSYLRSRLQTVSINGHLSSFLPVLSGVPQGSLLGPLLFVIFINDLPSYVHTAKLLLFADDTKCYSSSNHSAQLQEDITRLFQWSLTNISFNSSKLSSLRFNTTVTCSSPDYFLNDQPIQHSNCQKDLGVIFSNDLSWSSHYEKLVAKAFKTLGLIRRIVGTQTTVTVRKNLYMILVRSQLTYCSQIWRPHLVRDIASLENVQCKATKWILNDFVSDYRSRLESLHLLPLMMIFEINDVTFFMKSIQSPNPAFDISEYVSFSSSSTRSHNRKLCHNYTKYSSSRHFYFNRLPRLWNKLVHMVDIINCSIPTARKRLHELMWQAFLQQFNGGEVCTFHFMVLVTNVS